MLPMLAMTMQMWCLPRATCSDYDGQMLMVLGAHARQVSPERTGGGSAPYGLRGGSATGKPAASPAGTTERAPRRPYLAHLRPEDLALLDAQCKAGEMRACLVVADDYSLGTTRSELNAAVALYADVCRSGLPAGCQGAGGLYASKALGAPNLEAASEFFGEAREVYEQRCVAGDGSGCGSLVDMLDADQIDSKGDSRTDWDKRTRSLLGAACSDKDVEACLALASYCQRREDSGCYRTAQAAACKLGSAAACQGTPSAPEPRAQEPFFSVSTIFESQASTELRLLDASVSLDQRVVQGTQGTQVGSGGEPEQSDLAAMSTARGATCSVLWSIFSLEAQMGRQSRLSQRVSGKPETLSCRCLEAQ